MTWKVSLLRIIEHIKDGDHYTLPETNMFAAENRCSECDFPFGSRPIFRGSVSFRKGNPIDETNWNQLEITQCLCTKKSECPQTDPEKTRILITPRIALCEISNPNQRLSHTFGHVEGCLKSRRLLPRTWRLRLPRLRTKHLRGRRRHCHLRREVFFCSMWSFIKLPFFGSL